MTKLNKKTKLFYKYFLHKNKEVGKGQKHTKINDKIKCVEMNFRFKQFGVLNDPFVNGSDRCLCPYWPQGEDLNNVFKGVTPQYNQL